MTMKTFQQMIKEKKEKWNAMAEERIKSEFRVVERDGTIYLTHNDVAFMSIDDNATAKVIAQKLEVVRNTAVKYAKL